MDVFFPLWVHLIFLSGLLGHSQSPDSSAKQIRWCKLTPTHRSGAWQKTMRPISIFFFLPLFSFSFPAFPVGRQHHTHMPVSWWAKGDRLDFQLGKTRYVSYLESNRCHSLCRTAWSDDCGYLSTNLPNGCSTGWLSASRIPGHGLSADSREPWTISLALVIGRVKVSTCCWSSCCARWGAFLFFSRICVLELEAV